MVRLRLPSTHRLLSVLWLLCARSATQHHHVVSDALANPKSKSKTYNYFAFGSNMASSTMINLRGITPLASTAAALPGHELRFNIPGMPGVEPSSAAVEPVSTSNNVRLRTGLAPDVPGAGSSGIRNDRIVHGVLYKLTEEDFAAICSTEGVPFAYGLHRCRVVPYVGDGKSAGEGALQRALMESNDDRTSRSSSSYSNAQSTSKDNWGVSAFTLRAARTEWRRGNDIPPSQSYLNVLVRSAKEFALDESYLRKLENMQAGTTLIGNGLAEDILRAAERRRRRAPSLF